MPTASSGPRERLLRMGSCSGGRTGRLGDMRFCGIDPGLNQTGYAVIETDGTRTPRIIEAGVLRTDRTAALASRLNELYRAVDELLAEHAPDQVAVEQIYSHYRHPRTAILMGHARGVILSASARHAIDVADLPATRVKRSLTGNGRASKRQVQLAIARTLGLPGPPEPADVADALAVALCAARSAFARGPI